MNRDSSKSPIDDGEIVDDESKEFDDGYDENLMGDEEDKKRLASMTEKERETELYNRGERRETLKMRFEIERRLKSNKAKKRELEKKQSKSQVRARKKLRASDIYSDESTDDSDREYTPNFTHTTIANSEKMNTRQSMLVNSSTSSSSSSSASSESSSSESEVEDDEDQSDDDRHVSQDDFQMTLDELKKLQLKRDQIEKWVYTPFFKETVVGLFVKISVGNHPQTNTHMYKVAQITDITQGNIIYALNLGKNKTDKRCVVKIGQAERTYHMSFVSNRSFDEEDYNRWREINAENMPTREYYNKKRRDLVKAINYVYSNEDVAYEVTERSRLGENPQNFALKKKELMDEKADAEASNNFERAREIQQLIDELEEEARKLENTRCSRNFSALSFVNERNRKQNIVQSERVLSETKSIKTEDPFTRRKCAPTIVHIKGTDKNGQDLPKSSANTSNSNQSAAKTEKVDSVDDLFQAHASIALDVDLDSLV